MSSRNRKGVEEARSQFPALLAEAERGRPTVITRHGRSIAAIVPIEGGLPGRRQRSLLGLAGTGKGLWGASSRRTMRALRGEWQR